MGDLRSGELDRRITIERFTETRDEFNNVVKIWADLATVWASKLDVSDSERVASQEVGAEISTRFRVRYSSVVSDLNPKDRLRFGGRVYEISAVKEIERREGFEISASARAEN